MKGAGIIFVFVVLGLAVWGGSIFFNYYSETIDVGSFVNSIGENVSYGNGESQFYSNMRFRDKRISYNVEEACDSGKVEDIEKALATISSKTVLTFYESNTEPEINFLCSEVSPPSEDAGHFVAGEGGPVDIINITRYSVILSSKVSLYRSERCDKPKIAIHEILHALGFDHNRDTSSIMYPVSNCEQVIDQYLIDDIEKIYRETMAPDLVLEQISVNKTANYLNFNLTVGNYGLADSQSAKLILIIDDNEIKGFDTGAISIGTKKMISVSNVNIGWTAKKVRFEVKQERGIPETRLFNNFAEFDIK